MSFNGESFVRQAIQYRNPHCAQALPPMETKIDKEIHRKIGCPLYQFCHHNLGSWSIQNSFESQRTSRADCTTLGRGHSQPSPLGPGSRRSMSTLGPFESHYLATIPSAPTATKFVSVSALHQVVQGRKGTVVASTTKSSTRARTSNSDCSSYLQQPIRDCTVQHQHQHQQC